jgi:hypothetical protein
MLDHPVLDTRFRPARTDHGGRDKPVSPVPWQALWDRMKRGPTSANCSPARGLCGQTRPESVGAGARRAALHVPVTAAGALVPPPTPRPGRWWRSGHHGGGGKESGGLPRPPSGAAFPARLSGRRPCPQCGGAPGACSPPPGLCRPSRSNRGPGSGQYSPMHQESSAPPHRSQE